MPTSPYRTPPESPSSAKNREPSVGLIVACALVVWLALHFGSQQRNRSTFEPSPPDMNAHGGARGRR